MRFLAILTFLFLPFVAATPQSATTDIVLPLCSAAVHNSYTTLGPDGVRYPTWHPQIDAKNGCRFDHEHGSNPAFFKAGVSWRAGSGVWPMFGYSAAQMGMAEGHAGFKVYVFRVSGYRFMLTQHQGTANALNAACNSMHTLDVVALRESDNAIVVDYHGMGDFGPAVENRTGIRLIPPNCSEQGTQQSAGIRLLPVGAASVGYEPWRVDVKLPNLDARFAFNTLNPQTACDVVTCTANLQRTDIGGNARGTLRIVTIEWLKLDSVNLFHGACYPYGQDYWYDCTEQVYDELPYRMNPLITGAN